MTATASPANDLDLADVSARKLEDETVNLERLLESGALPAAERARALHRARDLVRTARARRADRSPLDAFLEEYGLSNEEGVALMCLAEALLRIPDDDTIDELIADKIPQGRWSEHLGGSDAMLVNASTWALMLTGRVIEPDQLMGGEAPRNWFRRMVSRMGEPVIRESVKAAMRILGREFVLGETIADAIRRGGKEYRDRALFSFDMLGEGARTMEMAERYLAHYAAAIDAVVAGSDGDNVRARDGISIKLSALHPRYDHAHFPDGRAQLYGALKSLALSAARGGIGFNIDAEEADRLEISMDLFEALARDPDLSDFDGLGFVVQAYGKRATGVIAWLDALARETGRNFMVRLVKGAYWDAEIKHAQVEGGPRRLPRIHAQGDHGPLLSRLRPHATCDRGPPLSSVRDAQRALGRRDHGNGGRSPRFRVPASARHGRIALRRLRGRLERLPASTHLRAGRYPRRPARLSRAAPARERRELFVEEVVEDPVAQVRAAPTAGHPDIALPADLYAPRRNSASLDLAPGPVTDALADALRAFDGRRFEAGPILSGRVVEGQVREVFDPADRTRIVGAVSDASAAQVDLAVRAASAAQPAWNALGGTGRAAVLDRIGDAYEAELERLMYLAVREAGKTLPDALAEVREAVDFCRYYADRARDLFAGPQRLPGPTGERNELHLEGRGVFACISPWNFPLAIFTGQVTGALAAGNAVIAKPAEQTCLIAAEAIRLMHEAGVPGDVLRLVCGDGPSVGVPLVRHPGIDGVAFTGSDATARAIRLVIAEREGPMIPLIAETGGLNAMFVDSSALLEQVTDDVVRSAFGSAGQRCSALRVLYLQADVYERGLALIRGAMTELIAGDPMELATDLGPVIDAEAMELLEAHIERMREAGHAVERLTLPTATHGGTFVAPTIVEVPNLDAVGGEHFGPVLHVRRFEEDALEACPEEVAASRYGLTLGVQSRIDRRCRQIAESMPVGNAYVNRNMIGAIVGSQPFGGRGLSGTGPKAGGPHYLLAFATERSVTVNTAASGGNAELLRLVR